MTLGPATRTVKRGRSCRDMQIGRNRRVERKAGHTTTTVRTTRGLEPGGSHRCRTPATVGSGPLLISLLPIVRLVAPARPTPSSGPCPGQARTLPHLQLRAEHIRRCVSASRAPRSDVQTPASIPTRRESTAGTWRPRFRPSGASAHALACRAWQRTQGQPAQPAPRSGLLLRRPAVTGARHSRARADRHRVRKQTAHSGRRCQRRDWLAILGCVPRVSLACRPQATWIRATA